ncbi:MAG: DNA polymerase III subunit delta [Methylococcaceae bacterium]|nr:DNA polymerase III subunit delta [Methylococcaceae bacterium]
MWLKTEQLSAALAKKLAPIYFLSGDEPLQLGEAVDAVRRAAKIAGYDSREVLTVDAGFSWADFLQAADSMSIFSEKKIIDLRMPVCKPGAEGSKALVNYCERLPEDTLLLISTGKLEKAAKKSKWLMALEKHGVVVQVWPLAGDALMQWLQQRLRDRGLIVGKTDVAIIASRVEGNLLAAAQEIEKLYVLYGQGSISNQQIQDAVADGSRYDVFNLVDAALSGRVERVLKILSGLRHEGIAAPIVLWALAREMRNLIHIKRQLDAGQAQNVVFMQYQVWDNRQKLVSYALARLKQKNLMLGLLLAAQADRQIKGAQLGDCWESLLQIALVLADKDVNAPQRSF